MKNSSAPATNLLLQSRSRACLVLLLLLTVMPAVAGQQIQAGAARVDITPPPGLPTGGHGPIGAIARGHLTRLYARAIFLRDWKNNSLLLVSVETFGVPQLFQFEVQKRFNAITHTNLPLESIVISATHTHQGPGNYFSAAVYNHLGSAVHGHVKELREFLINQIVSASVAAWTRAGKSKSVQLYTRQALLPLESLRNRSPETFMLNAEADDMMSHFDKRVKALGGTLAPHDAKSCMKAQQEREQDGGWDIEGCPRLRAVDREMTILDIKDSNVVVATLVFGAMHPTVAPPDTPLFNSDFVGLAMRQLERSASSGDPVVAFFNGAEGDISARRIERDIRDVWRLAKLMRDAIDYAKKSTAVDLSGGIKSKMHFAVPGDTLSKLRLAPEPKGGAAALGGGEGDRTPLYALGWKERVTDFRATQEQGAKLNALKSRLLPFLPDFTKALLADEDDFPSALPLGHASVGTFEIVSTPTEMSTATGYNIRKLLGFNTVIIGLANEYASYTTTADEYARQDYMAASTLWGPQESEFFVRALSMVKSGSLANRVKLNDRPGDDRLKNLEFDVGAKRQAVDEDLDLILRNRYRNPVRDLPYITWSDTDSGSTYDEAANTVVAIEEESGTLVEDDSAGRLIVLLLEKPKNGLRQWAAIWLAPLEDAVSARKVVFTVKTASGKCYKSESFTATDKREQRLGPCAARKIASYLQ